MKRFLIFLGALFIMLIIIGYNAKANDIVWIKQTHFLNHVQFSPDSKLILTSDGGQLYLHDVMTQETIREYSSMANPRFTPDGKYIVGYLTPNVHSTDNKLVILDIEKWEVRTDIEAPLHNISSYDLSSDGTKMIVTYDKVYKYSIWDIESGRIEKTFEFHPTDTANTLWMDISSINYGKEDRTIIYNRRKAIPQSGINGYNVLSSTHIIDAETGLELFKFNPAGMLNFSHDKSIVTERYVDKKVSFRVFKVENWEPLYSIPGAFDININYLNQITFSSDDKYVIAGYGIVNKKIVVYNLSNGEEKYTYKTDPPGGYFDAIDASNDGKYIAGGSGQKLILYNFDFETSVNDVSPNVIGFHSYPNPSNSNLLTFEFNILNSSITKIQLYDLRGKVAKNIENKFLEAGHHRYEIDINGLSSGQYNLILESLNNRNIHKVMINR